MVLRIDKQFLDYEKTEIENKVNKATNSSLIEQYNSEND